MKQKHCWKTKRHLRIHTQSNHRHWIARTCTRITTSLSRELTTLAFIHLFSAKFDRGRVLFASAANPLWHFRRFKMMLRCTEFKPADTYNGQMIIWIYFSQWTFQRSQSTPPILKKIICLPIFSMIIAIGCVFKFEISATANTCVDFAGFRRNFQAAVYEAISDNGLIYRKSFCWLIHAHSSFRFKIIVCVRGCCRDKSKWTYIFYLSLLCLSVNIRDSRRNS